MKGLVRTQHALIAITCAIPTSDGPDWTMPTMERKAILSAHLLGAGEHDLLADILMTGRNIRAGNARGASEGDTLKSYNRFFASCVAYATDELEETEDQTQTSHHLREIQKYKAALADGINEFNFLAIAFKRNGRLGTSLVDTE